MKHNRKCQYCGKSVERSDKKSRKYWTYGKDEKRVYEFICGECWVIQYGISCESLKDDFHHCNRLIGLLFCNEFTKEEREYYYSLGIKHLEINKNLIKAARRGKIDPAIRRLLK